MFSPRHNINGRRSKNEGFEGVKIFAMKKIPLVGVVHHQHQQLHRFVAKLREIVMVEVRNETNRRKKWLMRLMILVVAMDRTFCFIPSSTFSFLSPYLILQRCRPLFLLESDDDAIMSPQNRTVKQQPVPLDVEGLRQQFEALLSSDIDNSSDAIRQNRNTSTSIKRSARGIPPSFRFTLQRLSLCSSMDDVHEPPLLTSLDRERRVLEIQLLEQLLENDDVVMDHLWSLWYSERGRQAAQRLNDATVLSNNPRTWKEAEAILRALILEYGIYWVEPLNRLATLFYIQGKYQQSIDLCLIILYVKPWHFGALSGIVALYGQVNNVEQARVWAQRRLPTFLPISNPQNNPRRKEWIQMAVQNAKESLRDAEDRLRRSFGERDAEQSRDPIAKDDSDSESWQ
jgi:hypothetical protein